MGDLARSIKSEILKSRHSPIIWVTFIAFALAPLMGGVFMIIVSESEIVSHSGVLAMKANAMNFSRNWDSYLAILTQAVAVGGILVFGFVASWVFGREYSEGTYKDLLSLPISRTNILNAKFVLYVMWCTALVISNLLLALIIASVVGIDPPTRDLSSLFFDYAFTTLLTVLLGSPLAFFALWGKGYLAPLGLVAITLVFAQIIVALGYGSYFPWSIPGLYSGAGGEYKNQLTWSSYILVLATFIVGYLVTISYWNKTDHSS